MKELARKLIKAGFKVYKVKGSKVKFDNWFILSKINND